MGNLCLQYLFILGFPDEVKSDNEKDRYIKKLNEHHDFDKNLALTISDIKKNEMLVKISKMSQNSMLGRWSLSTRDVEKCEITQEPQEFLSVANDKNKRISHFRLLDAITVLMTFKSTRQRSIITNAQALIGGWVPQIARKLMWQELKSIYELGGKLMWWDTDAIAYMFPIDRPHNLQIEPYLFGMWKYEVDPKKVFR